jgi:NIPSNAP
MAVVLGAVSAVKGLSAKAAEAATNYDTVYELRQYTLHRGQRDKLIRIFEEHFIEPQNALGAHIVGTFRDLDDPDRFVWIRSFQDMKVRQQSLETFYGGPVWLANRQAANATMLDSDNVLLLRPVGDEQAFASDAATPGPSHIIGAWVYYLDKTPPEDFAAYFDRSIMTRLAAMGVRPVARLVTEGAANNFRLPIRERDRVYVWLARWNALKEEEEFSAHWNALSGWRDDAPESVLPALMRKPERLRLSPTARSALR